ncbi:hypothetical protein EK21DRAFT_87584 [Setomelanomma holmii]|uniref:Uncharacterized protein n=1 Tax=Setomelanomma holmii TaxID=210430 RepID=A0A9P4HFA1_9PLEO|nr:hypothetical protein EK21DRAFT_87584 [Setomelanomma holmii]
MVLLGFSRCFAGLYLAHTCLTSSLSFSPHLLVARDIDSLGGDANATILTADEIHANVLRNWPTDQIIASADIEITLARGDGATYYVNDTQSWVTATKSLTERDGEDGIVARQQCTAYEDRKVTFSHEFWGPWHAVTSCLLSDAGQGGSVSFSVTDTLAISVGGDIGTSGWEGLLSAGFSFTVTFSKSYSFQTSCNVVRGQHGQVWGRHRMGWAAVQSRSCSSCNGGTTCTGWKNGYISSMASDDNVSHQQWGCSTSPGSYLKGC